MLQGETVTELINQLFIITACLSIKVFQKNDAKDNIQTKSISHKIAKGDVYFYFEPSVKHYCLCWGSKIFVHLTRDFLDLIISSVILEEWHLIYQYIIF